MGNPVIVCGVRTPVGKALKGTLRNYRPDDLAGAAMKEALRRVPQIKPEDVGDIVMGCAMPEGEQGMNAANIAKFIAGIPHSVPAMTLNRFCSSGLQSIAVACDSITAWRNDIAIAGGMESMSMIPMAGNKIAPNPDLVDNYPEVYLSMGHTAERVAEKYGVSRKDQDEFACRSHTLAAAAIAAGKFADEVVPIRFTEVSVEPDGKKVSREIEFSMDEGARADTSVEVLSGLKPVFKMGGTVTAGNASQMSDGAAALILMSEEKAAALGIKPLARLVAFAAAGVEPELMGIGPIKAIPKALEQADLKLEDIDLVELNEAFASQALAVIRELGLNPDIVNVNGGAIALGHPMGATGAILTIKIINELKRKNGKYGLVTMCIGGGMGAAGIVENL